MILCTCFFAPAGAGELVISGRPDRFPAGWIPARIPGRILPVSGPERSKTHTCDADNSPDRHEHSYNKIKPFVLSVNAIVE